MMTTKLHCLVVRVPAEAPETPPRAAWREALPWADPYILGLIKKLQNEVREERAAAAMARRELAVTLAELPARNDFTHTEAELLASADGAERGHHECPTCIAFGSPPSDVIVAQDAADGEEEEFNGNWNREIRQPR